MACNLSFVVKNEGVLKVTGYHVHFKSGSVLKTVLDKDVETTVHKQEVIIMPYVNLIAVSVMTFGVCQGHSLIASFSILTSALCCPSAIAELLILCNLNSTRNTCCLLYTRHAAQYTRFCMRQRRAVHLHFTANVLLCVTDQTSQGNTPHPV